MRLNKIFATVAIASVAVGFAAAQNSMWIRVESLGTDVPGQSEVSRKANQASIGLNPNSGIQYVLVTTYARFEPNTTLGRLGLINSFIDLRGIPGVRVYDGFPNNRWDGGTTTYSDARKNAFSFGDELGNRAIDSAGNNLRNNSAQPFASPGDGIVGAAGKTLFSGGVDTEGEGALYSFVIEVDTNVLAGQQFTINYARVGATEGVPLRTNFGYEFDSNFAPSVEGALVVVPEPASMIALGSGLVGLLALRRRKK